MVRVETRTWQELCEEASNEFDPERLMTLISELVKVLDETEPTLKRREGASALY